jgi:hypothetical protein
MKRRYQTAEAASIGNSTNDAQWLPAPRSRFEVTVAQNDFQIETIASVTLASPITLSILWERGPSRERSLATVAPYLRIPPPGSYPITDVGSGLATIHPKRPKAI